MFGIGQNRNPHTIRTKIELPLTPEEREEREKWIKEMASEAKQPRCQKEEKNTERSDDESR